MENNLIKKKLVNEFRVGFKKLKLYRTKNLYVTSNLKSIAHIRIYKEDKLNIILNTLKEVMGKSFTIFSPSASMNLCNKKITFDLNKTPSYQMGPLAEHIRTQKNSVRSIHPYWSVCGIGKNSKILRHVSNHSYAHGSPWSKMLDLDTTQLNIGVHPSRAVTLIHHIETISGVPYRFNKKFKCKVIINKKTIHDDFFMSVFFKNQKIQKRIKLNEHFFNEMKKLNLLNNYKTSFGLNMWSFKMRDFFNVAIKYFLDDIYNYLEFRPDLSYHNDL